MIRGQIAWARAPTILSRASFARDFAEDENDQDFCARFTTRCRVIRRASNFAVVVTDSNGDSNPPADLAIRIVDDTPIARADSDTNLPGTDDGRRQRAHGLRAPLQGVGNADVSGADGGMQVVGVAKGRRSLGGAAPGTVGVAIGGNFGTLTLNADGSYSLCTYGRRWY